MLGKGSSFILNYYCNDPEYEVIIDTINEEKLLIKCTSLNIYPHHNFEINRIFDRCIAYSFTSKNKDVLNTYLDMLKYLGNLVVADEEEFFFKYLVTLPDKKVYYTIRKPFQNNMSKSKKDIFYILVKEMRKL